MGKISSESENVTFARLALALANDYESIYYLNSEDDSYIEYKAAGETKALNIASSGDDFFRDTVINVRRIVYPEDQERFLSAFRKEAVLEALSNGGSFNLKYRLVIDGRPTYYYLKMIRGTGMDDKNIFIGVRNIDEQERKELAAAAEYTTYSQIAGALASRYEVIYYIDTSDNSYIQYSASKEYAKLGVSLHGTDFFTQAAEDIRHFVCPEDRERIAEEFDREHFLANLLPTGTFTMSYRQYLEGRPQYVSMIAVMPKNDDHHIVIGVMNIDSQKQKESRIRTALGNAMEMAIHDPLTSVKNKLAYQNTEAEMNEAIMSGKARDFAIAVFDVNGLKEVNDSLGHIAGDEYIKSACEIICVAFEHSPVFRVGGDEFAVLLKGRDFENRDEIMKQIKLKIEDNQRKGLVTISGGISVFDPSNDNYVGEVFARADNIMYNNKKVFKDMKKQNV